VRFSSTARSRSRFSTVCQFLLIGVQHSRGPGARGTI
jgi:hypothetical protein